MSEPMSAHQAAPRSSTTLKPAPAASNHDQPPGHPLAELHGLLGNRGVLQRLAVQPKLDLGAPDDEHEREADAVAAAVMRKTDDRAIDALGAGGGPRLSRQPEDEKRRPTPPSKKAPAKTPAKGGAARTPAKGGAAKPPAQGRAEKPPVKSSVKPPLKPGEAKALAQKPPQAKRPAVSKPEPKPPPKPAPKPKTGSTAREYPPGQQPPSPTRSGGPPNRELWPPPPERARRPDEPLVQAKPATPDTAPSVTQAAARTISSAQGGGHPLGAGDRSFFESRLGRDLSAVRVHDDAAAHRAARDIQARAFTYGSDIFFAAGRHQPGTSEGRELLAHELAHTIQQRPGAKLEPRVQRAPAPQPATGDGAAGVTRDPATWTITFPELQVPNFRLESPKYAGPLTRPKGYKRSEVVKKPQRQVWIDDTKESVQKEIPPLLESIHASLHEGQYFLHQAGRRMPERYYIGLPEQLAENLTTPEWDEAGQGHGFRGFQVDHVLELQLGGANEPENLELLDKDINSDSGRFIMESIEQAMAKYIAALPDDQRSDPTLKLGDWRANWNVKFLKPAKPSHRTAKEPGANDRWKREDIKAGKHFKAPGVLSEADPDKLGSKSEVKIFPSQGGGIVSTLRPAEGPAGVHFFKPFKASSAQYFVNDTSGPDLAKFTFELTESKALVPPPPKDITVKRLAGARFVGSLDRGSALDVLRNLGAQRLSPITIETAEVGPHGIYAEGQIIADLPIIKDTPIDLVLDGPKLTISHTFESGDFKLPSPFKVTQSTLRVSASTSGELAAAGRVDAEIEKLGQGFLAAEASTRGGLSLSGGFDFTSEIFQQAHVSFAYHDGHYSGEGTLSIASGKVAGLKSGTLQASYAEDHFDATGHAAFDIPGIDSADIQLGYDATTGLRITAAPQLKKMPGLKSGSLSLTVTEPPGGGDVKLSGHGSAEPDIPGIDAQLTVDYDDGAFLAKVAVPFQMGLINGQIEAGATNQPVGEDGRPVPTPGAHGDVQIFGAGTATIQITPWLNGTAAIRLLPNGEVEVHGELAVPGYPLWHGNEIFNQEIVPKISADVPIFPPIELHLAAGLRFRVGYGDGVLSGSIGITYNPSHTDQTALQGALHLHASAYAGLELETEVGLAVGVPGASISANVTLGGELRIDGNLDDDVQIDWSATQGLAIKNTLKASLEPALVISLGVDIVGTLGPFSHTFWEDNLANYRWGSGFQMQLIWPIQYVEGQPFQPSIDDIHVDKPNLAPDQVAKQILEERANA